MASDFKTVIAKCDGCNYEEECREMPPCILDAYNKGRADAIDEFETKLVDIILGNEEFTDWQKQEISLCLECVIEQLKEQSDGQDKEE